MLKNPGLDLVNLDNNKDLGSGDSRMYMLKERIVNALMTYADFECSEKEREELEVAFENMQQESEKKWQEIKAKEAFLRPKKNRKC